MDFNKQNSKDLIEIYEQIKQFLEKIKKEKENV